MDGHSTNNSLQSNLNSLQSNLDSLLNGPGFTHILDFQIQNKRSMSLGCLL